MDNKKLFNHLKKLYNLSDEERDRSKSAPTPSKSPIPQAQASPAPLPQTPAAKAFPPTPSALPPTAQQPYAHYQNITSIGPSFGQSSQPSSSAMHSPASRYKGQLKKDTMQGLQNYKTSKVSEAGEIRAVKSGGDPISWDDYKSDFNLESPSRSSQADLYNWALTNDTSNKYLASPEGYITDLRNQDGFTNPQNAAQYTAMYDPPAFVVGPALIQTGKNLAHYGNAQGLWNYAPKTPVSNIFTGWKGNLGKGVAQAPTTGLAITSGAMDLATVLMDMNAANEAYNKALNGHTLPKGTELSDGTFLEADRRVPGWLEVRDAMIAAGMDLSNLPPKPYRQDYHDAVRQSRGVGLIDQYDDSGFWGHLGQASGLIAAPYQLAAALNAPSEYLRSDSEQAGTAAISRPDIFANRLYSGLGDEIQRFDFSQMPPEALYNMGRMNFYNKSLVQLDDNANQNNSIAGIWDRWINTPLAKSMTGPKPEPHQIHDIRLALADQIRDGNMSLEQLQAITKGLGINLGKAMPQVTPETRADPRIRTHQAQHLRGGYGSNLRYTPETFHSVMSTLPEGMIIPIYSNTVVDASRRRAEAKAQNTKDRLDAEAKELRDLQQSHREDARILQRDAEIAEKSDLQLNL